MVSLEPPCPRNPRPEFGVPGTPCPRNLALRITFAFMATVFFYLWQLADRAHESCFSSSGEKPAGVVNRRCDASIAKFATRTLNVDII